MTFAAAAGLGSARRPEPAAWLQPVPLAALALLALRAGPVPHRARMADARAENPLSRWLTELEASRPGAHRTADLPMLSPHIACGIAFVVYPSVVLGLQALLAGRAYATDARWLRYIGAVHNALLGVFSLGMWLGVFYTLGTDSTYSSAVEFFCLPSAEPVMPARLSLFPYLFYLSKIYEVGVLAP
jgi:hypothetical protein